VKNWSIALTYLIIIEEPHGQNPGSVGGLGEELLTCGVGAKHVA